MASEEVRQDIGRIEGKLEMLVPLLQQVLTKQDAIQASLTQLHNDNNQTKSKINELEAQINEIILPTLNDYKEKKLIGTTLVVASGAAGGFAGGGIIKALWLLLTGGH